MSRWTPCKRRDAIAKLRALGFNGPHPGSRHQHMFFGDARLILPSYNEFGVDLVRNVVQQAEVLLGRPIPLEEWERL